MNYSSTHPQTSRSMICPLVKLGRSSPPKTETHPKHDRMSLNERNNANSPIGGGGGTPTITNGECYPLDLNYSHGGGGGEVPFSRYSNQPPSNSYGPKVTSPILRKQQEDELYSPYFSQFDYKNNRQKLDSYELQENRNYALSRSRYDGGSSGGEYNNSRTCRNLTRLSNLSISNELYWNGLQNSQDSEQSENGKDERDETFQRSYYQSPQQMSRRISSPFSSYMTDNCHKITAPFSPNCDQGYHTLLFSSQNCQHSSAVNLESWHGNTNLFKGKRVNQKETIFDRLTDDVVLKIFSYLHSFDLSTCAQVCRRFESLAWKPCLWRTITFSGEQKRDDKEVRTDIRTILKQLCAQNQGHICLNIERVYISDGAKITDREIMFLARRCPELTHLQIHGCTAVSNVAIHELVTRCLNLHHLDITGCTNVSSITLLPGPEPVLRLALQYLDLTDCVGINDHSLRIIVKSCPQLVYLYLRRCLQITDIGLKYVPSFCSGLREFSVSDCSKVTDFGLYELAKLGATLRYLSVAKCDQVSDAGLKVIARRCYKLRYLNARGCEAVSDDAITVLARSCTRLRALDIGKCDVSDAGLKALAECCPNIKKLSLRNCDLITNRGIKCIAYYCRGLQQLNIQDCQITIEGYRAVKQYCRRCIIEHTNPGFF